MWKDSLLTDGAFSVWACGGMKQVKGCEKAQEETIHTSLTS